MIKVSRIVYATMAWLFAAGVLFQVYLAGMVVVAGRIGWDNHRNLGHILGGPLLFMLISAYTGRLPGAMKRLTWLLFLVYIIQADVIIFMRGSAPFLSAFHPVLALIDFVLGVTLVIRARGLARQPQPEAAAVGIPQGQKQPAG